MKRILNCIFFAIVVFLVVTACIIRPIANWISEHVTYIDMDDPRRNIILSEEFREAEGQ